MDGRFIAHGRVVEDLARMLHMTRMAASLYQPEERRWISEMLMVLDEWFDDSLENLLESMEPMGEYCYESGRCFIELVGDPVTEIDNYECVPAMGIIAEDGEVVEIKWLALKCYPMEGDEVREATIYKDRVEVIKWRLRNPLAVDKVFVYKEA